MYAPTTPYKNEETIQELGLIGIKRMTIFGVAGVFFVLFT